ncbi:MAG: hypothetical protein Q4B05_00035 [Candidatus Saccharibacteria bacterium]|nr:hypothetical protein [Candidatus Saccharibacteria bacterium]
MIKLRTYDKIKSAEAISGIIEDTLNGKSSKYWANVYLQEIMSSANLDFKVFIELIQIPLAEGDADSMAMLKQLVDKYRHELMLQLSHSEALYAQLESAVCGDSAKLLEYNIWRDVEGDDSRIMIKSDKLAVVFELGENGYRCTEKIEL